MRRKIGNWLPTATQEKLINRHLASDTDWSRSVAFGMPTLYTGYVRINLKGREPQGIVEPGNEYRQVVEQIAEDFSKLESPRVAKIRRMADLCAGKPPELVPDLVISWVENDRPWDEIVHPRFRAPLPRHQFHRSTYHSYRGFLAALDADLLDGIPVELDIPDVAGHLARTHGRQPVGS
jgi:predicted AlkP superfamily phosphohydrolase/phosphomutase